MNAYELADILDKHLDGWNYSYIFEAAAMLRKLQDDLSDLQRHIPAKELADKEKTEKKLPYGAVSVKQIPIKRELKKASRWKPSY